MRYFDQLLGKIVAWRGYRVVPIRSQLTPMRIAARALGGAVEVTLGTCCGGVDFAIMLPPSEANGLADSIYSSAREAFSNDPPKNIR